MSQRWTGGVPYRLMKSLLLVVFATGGLVLLGNQPSNGRQSMVSPPPNPLQTGAPAVVVRMQGSNYVPNAITLRIGQSVKFENDDSTGHTATASDGSFDSGFLGKGESWQTTFSHTGTVLFSDIYHTSMHGQITVVVN